MLDYQYDVTIPANTPASDPVVQELKLTRGKLVKVVLIFQSGCAYMAHVALFIGTRQIMPVIEGQSYALDDYTMVRDTNFMIDEHPFSITFKGWSPNTVYDHTIGILATVDTGEDEINLADIARLLS